MENNTVDYFHGRLDRRSAETRLTLDGNIGSFLVRESDRKSGSYVLSYLGTTGINHFRITHAYGSYFIGGRQFESLSELITYYSVTSDLLTNERLLHPVAPNEPVPSKERLFISILPYSKLAQSDELSFKKGNVFILQNDLGDGWLWCRDVRTGQSGLVFADLVEELKEDIDPNEVFPWFHSQLSKADAVNKLAEAGPGSFLVRPSDNSPGNYTLFYHVGTTVQRFLIVRNDENRYTMGGKCFDSLGQIVDYYHQEQIIEGHVLQFPVITTLSRADQLSETTLSRSMRALEIRDKPQDVYNTVKLSREAAKIKQSNQLKGWLGLKKDDSQKKWKNFYFVLNTRDRHLYYYEKPQQTKPRGLIDLSYSFMYTVHESLFDWPQCLLLVEKCLPCFANQFYIRCEEERETFNMWTQMIKRYVSPGQSNRKNVNKSTDNGCETISTCNKSEVSTCDTFEEKRSLYLNFIEANSLRVKDPYLVISYNVDIKVAKTGVKTSPTAVFTDDGYFALENLSPDIISVAVSLYQNNKKPKSAMELPHFTIDLRRMKSEQLDSWFEFRTTQPADAFGYLRLKMKHSNDIVMSLSEYAALEDLICEPSAETIMLLDQICHSDHLTLARCLSSIFRRKRSSTIVLKTLIEHEISQESDASSLFRSNSLTASLIEFYMRSMCQSALIKCLRLPVKKLLDDKICCELNANSSQNVSQKACENLQNLLDLLDELVGNIYESASFFPLHVRYLFSCLRKAAHQRWPQEQLVKTRAVSGFLFLRLLCPTLLNPKQFNLINETPSENTIRNLTLLAKCLQNLGNLVETSKSNNSLAQSVLKTLDDYACYPMNQSQPAHLADYSSQTSSILEFILSPQIESWMEVVDPFILKNKIGLTKFIDEICCVEFADLASDEHIRLDGNNNLNHAYLDDHHDPSSAAYQLSIVHGVCEKYRTDLNRLANSTLTAKKLATIISILSQHKQYYANYKRGAEL